MSKVKISNMECPIPLDDYKYVMMAHGSGGRMMGRLIDEMFLAVFTDVQPQDSAILNVPQGKIAMTTDSFVVRPLFFPGGDIGSLAVNGTVNDLAMCGARPQYLSVSFILEEGLAMETLWRVIQSMHKAADVANVTIVTGDTKVVERGHGDGLYINTTGIGVLEHGHNITPEQVKAGDMVILSGDIGRHGIAVMAEREGLSLRCNIESDCAPLFAPVQALLDAGLVPHALRDATRGGVATVLNEIATAAGLQINVSESTIHVEEGVRGVCEILGFDPLHIANEGCFIAFVAAEDHVLALDILRKHNKKASLIGTVSEGKPGRVTIETSIGGVRILDMPAGELLPRIC